MNTPLIAPSPTSPQITLVTFRVDGQTYALSIEPIIQIIPMVTITPVPQTNEVVAGVINVRGSLVPVISLRRHLTLPQPSLQLHTPILLVKCQGRPAGLIVDDVLDVISLPQDQIASPNDILPQNLAGAPIFHGLVNTSSGTLFVLDVETLFPSPQTVTLSQATLSVNGNEKVLDKVLEMIEEELR